jgi:hypothetical protein
LWVQPQQLVDGEVEFMACVRNGLSLKISGLQWVAVSGKRLDSRSRKRR